MAKYDVVVIGAGIAGLTAAAYLARGGARVVVCEQDDRAGGYFYSFRREGYLFDAGIKAIENAGIMRPTLAQLGLLDKVNLLRSPIALITETDVQPIRSPEDITAYFNSVMAWFPDQREGLTRILRDVQSIATALGALVGMSSASFAATPAEGRKASGGFGRIAGALARVPAIMSLTRGTLRGYLEQRLSNPRVVNLLCDVFPDGTTPFFGLAYYSMFLDYYYPQGGMQRVPDVLAAAIREWGGEVRTRSEVLHIGMASGRATGVTLADGTEIHAGYVISCGDARRAFTQLLPEGAVPPQFLATLLKAEPSHSVFTVFLGVDLPAEDLRLQGCPHVFYAPDRNGVGGTDRQQTADYFARVPQEISVPCIVDAGLAPPGKSGIILSALTTWHYADHWGTDNGKPTERYEQLRARFASQMVASLEKFIPGLASRTEFLLTGTPYTLNARTSNYEGAIMGWSYDRTKTLHRGSLLQMAKSVRTPVPNLYMAGHWAFSPGGSPVAVMTGKLAANQILKTTGRK